METTEARKSEEKENQGPQLVYETVRRRCAVLVWLRSCVLLASLKEGCKYCVWGLEIVMNYVDEVRVVHHIRDELARR